MSALTTPPQVTLPAKLPLPLDQGDVFCLGRHLRRTAGTPSGRRAARRAMRSSPRSVERLALQGADRALRRLTEVFVEPDALDLSTTYLQNAEQSAIVRYLAQLGMVSLDDIKQARRARAPIDKTLLNGIFKPFLPSARSICRVLADELAVDWSPAGLWGQVVVSVDSDCTLMHPGDMFTGLEDKHWLLSGQHYDSLFAIASVLEHIAPLGYASPFTLYDYYDEMGRDGCNEELIDEVNTIAELVGGMDKAHAALTNNPASLPPSEYAAGYLAEYIEFFYLKTQRSLYFGAANQRRVPASKRSLAAGAPSLDIPESVRQWLKTTMRADRRIDGILKRATKHCKYGPSRLETGDDSSWFFGGFCLGAFPTIDYDQINDHYHSLQNNGFCFLAERPCPQVTLALSAQMALIQASLDHLADLSPPQ